MKKINVFKWCMSEVVQYISRYEQKKGKYRKLELEVLNKNTPAICMHM